MITLTETKKLIQESKDLQMRANAINKLLEDSLKNDRVVHFMPENILDDIMKNSDNLMEIIEKIHDSIGFFTTRGKNTGGGND